MTEEPDNEILLTEEREQLKTVPSEVKSLLAKRDNRNSSGFSK